MFVRMLEPPVHHTNETNDTNNRKDVMNYVVTNVIFRSTKSPLYLCQHSTVSISSQHKSASTKAYFSL